MSAAKKPFVAKVEDLEGSGYCGTCGRDNLRWIVTLSDGTKCGTECARRVLGYTIAPAKYKWVAGYAPIIQSRVGRDIMVVYRNEAGRTRLTINGSLVGAGGGLATYARLCDGYEVEPISI